VDELTRRVVLPNGVTLLVRELRAAPVVTLNLWVGTGAVDDPDGRAGTAHFIEHLLFGGRGGRAAGGQLVRQVLEAGGHLNGETGCDATTFYQILPREAWARVLEAQVGAVADASFDPEEIDAERSVIIEEARGSERQPVSFLWRRLMELSFPDHPCGRPVLGTEESLERITPPDLTSHFMAHYRGGNLVEVVCGDVDADETIERASAALARLPDGDRQEPGSESGRTVRGIRARGFEGGVDRSYVLMAHRVPGALHDDLPALDALTGLLGLGRSSRLRDRLQVDEGLVSSVDSGVVAYREAGVHVIRAISAEGGVESIVDAILDEIERLAVGGVSEREMEKNVRRLESAYALEHETSDSIARTLGHYETLGDFRMGEEYVDRLASVTASDVRRVAEQYLHDGACSIVSLAPADSGAPAGEWAPERGATAMRPRAARIEESSDTGHRPFVRPTFVAESSAPFLSRRRLENGAVLIVCRSRSVPVASLAVSFRGGHSEEPDGAAGVTYLTQKSLLRGTKRLPAALLAEEIETLGSGIGTAVDRDGFGVGLTVLSTRLERAAELLGEIIAAPAFDPAQVALARDEVLAEIGQSTDDPMRRALIAALPHVLPEHPYGRPVRGSRKSVGRLDAGDVTSWHAGRYVASRAVICGAGDVPETGFADQLVTRSAPGPQPSAGPPQARPQGDVVIETTEAGQSTVVVTFLGPPAGSDEAVALRVATRGLGMMGGPLWRELREKPPHAYSVGANVFQFARAGIVVGHASARPGMEEAVRDALIDVFEALSRQGLEADDLSRARRSAAGAYEIALQRGAARAAACSMAEILGTGCERVFRAPELLRRVTQDAVVGAASAHLTRDRGVASVIVRGR